MHDVLTTPGSPGIYGSYIDQALVRSGWLDFGQVLFLLVYGPKRMDRDEVEFHKLAK